MLARLTRTANNPPKNDLAKIDSKKPMMRIQKKKTDNEKNAPHKEMKK
jgi:hypothetical protein